MRVRWSHRCLKPTVTQDDRRKQTILSKQKEGLIGIWNAPSKYTARRRPHQTPF